MKNIKSLLRNIFIILIMVENIVIFHIFIKHKIIKGILSYNLSKFNLIGTFISQKEVWIRIGLTIVLHLIIIFIILVSVLKRKKAEKELKESEERLKTLINATPDIICFKDKDGRWLECNEAAQRIFDFKNDEWRGKNDIELGEMDSFYKETHMRCLSTDRTAWEKGEALRIEEKIVKKDGKINVFDTIKLPLYYKEGRKKGMVLFARDITERKNAEEKLKESEERYRRLIEFFPEAIFSYTEGISAPINEAALNLIGVKSFQELNNKNISEFIKPHPDYKETIIEANKKFRKGIPVQSLECKIIRDDNKVFDVEFYGFSFHYNNKINYISVLKDITHKKKNKELREKAEKNKKLLMEAKEYAEIKTEFMANISHELRTPLNVILSTIQLLELYIVDGNIVDKSNKMHRRIHTLKQNGYRLLRLVNNLIDITKIDAGFLDVQFKNYNIISIVENITLSVAEYIEYKGISLIFDTDIEEKFIACDPDKIEKIMLNLLANAVKFTKVGGNIAVYIKEKGQWIEISVKDTGIGIPPEKLEVIFERFRQVDKSLNRKHEGSGIGLYLVKSLVEIHGGKILVRSELEEGSEFSIQLPCKQSEFQENKEIDDSFQHNRIERIQLEFSDIYN